MRVLSFLLLLVGFTLTAQTYAEAPAAKGVAAVHAELAKHLKGLRTEQVRATPISGIYEIDLTDGSAYVTADGKYLIKGDLFEVASRANLSESRRGEQRRVALAQLDEKQTIVFSPENPKHTITVFTDVECGYCRKLHSQIDQLTKLGVKVRYAAYPRQGPGTSDWKKMEQVWCSKDRQTAITQAKLGQAVQTPSCGATPVGKQFQMGEDLGVRGTPAIFTHSGDYIGGYLAPDELVKQIEESEAREKKGS